MGRPRYQSGHISENRYVSTLFAIPLYTDAEHFSSLVVSWLTTVCTRNPQKFEVEIQDYEFATDLPTFIFLPACVFKCQSLVSLKLGAGFDYEFPCDRIISLPNLKELVLYYYYVDCELMSTLLKSCPLLECLDLQVGGLVGDELSLNFQKLRSFTLVTHGATVCDKYLINAPRLEHIHINDSSSNVYRFVENPTGLLTAKITLWDEEEYLSHALDIFQGISSVRSLCLGDTILDYLRGLENDGGALPVFPNLDDLNLTLTFNDWASLLPFLECIPKLKTIVVSMDGDFPDKAQDMNTKVPACLLSKLRRIDIKRFDGGGTTGLNFLEYVLSNANALEQLTVTSSYTCRELSKEFEWCQNLFCCPGSSEFCEVKFCGNLLKASSKDFKNGVLDCQIQVPRKSSSK